MAERDQDDADADADGLDNEQEGSYGEDGVRRPMNAFFIFCKRHRDVVREKYPHLENRSITKILGEWWANLDASEKSSYTALAKQYKEAFMKAHPDFKWYKLPTAPARTLVTRPSNNRCLQSKKEKGSPKASSACGIALGKIADEKELGGLSSLISQSSAETSSSPADTDNHDVAVTSVCISPPSSSSSPPSSSSSSSSSATSNILKPPKKRYIVNGEFKCSSEQTKCDSRDYQTQNACSALMELAEICANTAGQSRLPVTTASTSADGGLYKSIFTYPRSADYKSYSVLNTCSTSALQPSPIRCDPMKCRTSTTSVTYFQNVSSSVCSSEFLPHNPVTSIPDIQEQPLNLCKEKEKTFTASNQQLINHLVDKFLCDTPSAQSVSSSLSLECSNSPTFPKSSQIRQGFTLSAAIESAIDQAYSKTSPKSPAVSPVTKKPASATIAAAAAADPEEPPETVFIDKIKKACLASSRIQSEKLINSRYSLASSAFGESSKPAVVKEEEQTEADIKLEGSESKADTVKNESTGDLSCNLKREAKFSSSKYYSKYASPPKKSRVWCNLFMKEQLSNCELDGNTDAKNAILFDLASPVRRNSQRTCKGRRYQALITEGLLQSSKERKSATGRKPLPTNEKCKSKTSPTPQSPPPLPKSKRKKKELWKAKAEEEAEEASTAAKSEFDLNEKIASLPKCSLETLNKKKKGAPSAEPCTTDSKSSSSSATKAGKKAAKEANASVETADKVTEENSATSTGRFKTGGFDLEQHIASLPKCDIEVLNKRRNKKE